MSEICLEGVTELPDKLGLTLVRETQISLHIGCPEKMTHSGCGAECVQAVTPKNWVDFLQKSIICHLAMPYDNMQCR